MKPFKLINHVQNYPWGTSTYIPNLLGNDITGKPCAELWMGDHPRGTSTALIDSKKIPLNEVIEKYPDEILGEDLIKYGKHLPFLFKVLSAETPLSIQAHPNKSQAEKGFEEENTRGVPLNAFNRNYKDNNHKPEIICALTPFTAMCGFCNSKIIESNFLKLNSSIFRDKLQAAFKEDDNKRIKLFFSALMALDDEELESLAAQAVSWAVNDESIEAELIERFASLYTNDPGVLAPLFLNVYSLDPGEALYQGPGELHAYVEGTGIELMANSDNVLRGGLTPKHVDVQELLKVLNFGSSGKNILKPVKKGEGVFKYQTPSDEFVLEHYLVDENKSVEVENEKSLKILLCISGNAVLSSSSGNISISGGDSIFIPASVSSFSLVGSAEIYSAGIPREKIF